MLETYLGSPVACARLRAGAAADRIDAFADWLHCAGYTPSSIKSLLVSLAGWTDWMRTAGDAAQDLLAGLEACRAMLARQARVPGRGGPNKQSLAAAGVFVRFLRERGDIPRAAPAPRPAERWPVLGEFRSWMRTHRGLTESSLDVYEGILAGLLEALGDDPSVYTAQSLRAFVLERAKPHGVDGYRNLRIVGG